MALRFHLHEDLFLTMGMDEDGDEMEEPHIPYNGWETMWRRLLKTRSPKNKARKWMGGNRKARKRMLAGEPLLSHHLC